MENIDVSNEYDLGEEEYLASDLFSPYFEDQNFDNFKDVLRSEDTEMLVEQTT